MSGLRPQEPANDAFELGRADGSAGLGMLVADLLVAEPGGHVGDGRDRGDLQAPTGTISIDTKSPGRYLSRVRALSSFLSCFAFAIFGRLAFALAMLQVAHGGKEHVAALGCLA